MKAIVGVVLIVSLTGCTASMVNTRGDSKSPYAPINEKSSRGGTIRYLNQGWKWAINQRREDAYKQMFTDCSGPYRIIREGEQSMNGVSTGIPDSTTGVPVYYSAEERYWYMDFECEKSTGARNN